MATAREIVRKASKDETFRTQLLTDPKGAIAKEFGAKLPEGVTVRVHENTPNVVHLVLDQVELGASRRLSDQELQQVSGGLLNVRAVTGTNTWCKLV